MSTDDAIKDKRQIIGDFRDKTVLKVSQQQQRRRKFKYSELDDFSDKALASIVEDAISNSLFTSHYHVASMVPIRQDAHCYTFRAVTRTVKSKSGENNTVYPETLMEYLMGKDPSEKRPSQRDLLNDFRDVNCFDLVAIKFEKVWHRSATLQQIRLVREFHILGKLYQSSRDHLYLPVGIQLPITFGFVGFQSLSPSPSSIVSLSCEGEATTYDKCFMNPNTQEGAEITRVARSEVTDTSYLTLELVGPSMMEYKNFFKEAMDDSMRSEAVKVFGVQTVLKLMDQVLCRLLMLHRKDIVHLDLSPASICTGIGRVSNVIYLVNMQSAVKCSGFPLMRGIGSQEFSAVVSNTSDKPNYMVDVESFFYLLIHLLIDELPWSSLISETEVDHPNDEDLNESDLKTQLWGLGEGAWNNDLLHGIVVKVKEKHEKEFPCIGELVRAIYDHIRTMREVYHAKTHRWMNKELCSETSEMFLEYHELRKLLLFPFKQFLMGKSSFFSSDDWIRLHDIIVKYKKQAKDGKVRKETDDFNKSLFFFDTVTFDWGWDMQFRAMDNRRNADILGKTNDHQQRILEHDRFMANQRSPRRNGE